jgi:hypothetical protein
MLVIEISKATFFLFVKVICVHFLLVYSIQFLADGYFPDPQDRSKYHICNSGIDTVVSCPDGAIWDTVKRSCFYINMVSCGKDTYQVYETKSTQKGINRN